MQLTQQYRLRFYGMSASNALCGQIMYAHNSNLMIYTVSTPLPEIKEVVLIPVQLFRRICSVCVFFLFFLELENRKLSCQLSSYNIIVIGK